ncbi:MAG: dihydrofolate reductase family protein [Nocardioidaceae bacterium]
MGRLVYSAITSLDGYTVDAEGHFDWSAPDAEVHAAVNELLAPVGTHLYGRGMYDVLVAWETMSTGPDQEPAVNEFARIWHAADKIVYSTTLAEVSSDRTRIERDFDPETVRDLVADGDVSIGGPTIAAHAFRAGIVDEVHLFVSPVVVGGGTRALPDDVRLDLDLVGERRFANGVVQLGYRVR